MVGRCAPPPAGSVPAPPARVAGKRPGAPPERHPPEDGCAVAGRVAPAIAAEPRDERRGPDRPGDVRARAPTPAVADIGPPAVVERRVAPGGIVDPRPAVARHPHPLAV